MSKQKNIKFIALVTIFCLVTAYFSVLSPTTAYFVDTYSKNTSISFYLLSSEQTVSSSATSFNLKGATKFEDFNELLFDDVVYGQFITVHNIGEIPAKVYIEVTVPNLSAQNGLKYIVIPTSVSSIPPTFSPSGTNALKGDIKETIENRLYVFRNGFVDGVTLNNALTILNDYNAQVKTFSTAPLLQVGEYVGFQIYYWAQYGNLEGTINDTTSISTISYSAQVTVKALQNDSSAG